MANLTDKLKDYFKTEPSDSRYSYIHAAGADDEAGGMEVEVGEFLYGLVRMIKPNYILETGTYHGTSTMYMADALKDNGFGKITTLEYEQQNYQIAKERFGKYDLQNFIDAELISSLDYKTDNKFDLILLDTEPGIRFQELVKYYPNIKSGGFLFIHDLHPHMGQTNINNGGMLNWPFGTLPEEINDMLKDGDLKSVPFRTPRGLMMYYKPGVDDYHV